MLDKKEFEVLRYICESCENTSPNLIAEHTGYSLNIIKTVLEKLLQSGFIDKLYYITNAGIKELEPFRVKNAIILAAGMSTRFEPVSYELPKGLIAVKGEVMTERLIRQLQEAGVREIVLVIGYMMEKFFYLRDKYNIKLVVNNEYAVKNTHSSIYAARDYLSSTYICCADNYYPSNMFHQYEYRAFYCSIYLDGTSYVERGFVFDDYDLIIDTNKPSCNQWIMYGHAYYDQIFTDKFKPILESYYGKNGVEQMYWETIYAENVMQLPMYIKKCTSEDIYEFDNMDELKAFDKDYISNNKVKVFENICRILCCDFADIKDIVPVKKGLNNRSFKFLCNGKYYIYRHPGGNASNIIDRTKEAISLRAAKRLKIDDTLIYIDEKEGWKISKYIDTCEEFDFSNVKHIQLLADNLKRLHKSNVQIGFHFDYYKEANRLIEIVRHIDGISYRELIAAQTKIKPVFDFLKYDPWNISFCHNDLYAPNLLIEENKLHIIDWEFAGDSDIGFDICKLFAVYNPEYEKIDDYLIYYYGRPTTDSEKRHLFACATIIYYYWFIWGVYASKTDGNVTEYVMIWHDKMNQYCDEVLKYIKENSLWK